MYKTGICVCGFGTTRNIEVSLYLSSPGLLSGHGKKLSLAVLLGFVRGLGLLSTGEGQEAQAGISFW